MLNRYCIDASSLPPEERDEVYQKLERVCFITNVDLKNIGCYEVFLEETYDLKSLIDFPNSCIVTRY